MFKFLNVYKKTNLIHTSYLLVISLIEMKTYWNNFNWIIRLLIFNTDKYSLLSFKGWLNYYKQNQKFKWNIV